MSGVTLMTVLVQTQEPGFVDRLLGTLTSVGVLASLRVLAMLVIGIPFVYVASKWIRGWISTQVNPQVGLIVGKLVFYLALAALAVSTMAELGFSLTPLLGAAGVVGIALGFASQTSVSNVIAGLFLIAEAPFKVDDLVQVGDVTGRILSVDMMSVKLRTFDNRFVRIPNETLVKSTLINFSRFPIRRLDVRVGVAYKEAADRVRAVLLDVADKNPLALMEPEPLVIFEGFGDSSINFLFAVWTVQDNWLALKNSIQEEVKARFDLEGIEIPFPHRTLYVGSETGSFPVKIVQDDVPS